MCLLIAVYTLLVISNLCLAINPNEQLEQCKALEDYCQENSDCCSDLNCYLIQENKLCSSTFIYNSRSKHEAEEFIIPPYYNPTNQLYPYGISRPALPFYKPKTPKQNLNRKNLEWDHCQFHEDCGEGNCCYVHFRFRSLPKWFCRPNRNAENELCAPLTGYRSLKDVPAWKEQREKQQ